MDKEGLVKEKISDSTYLVEEIIEKKIYIVNVSSKQITNLDGFQFGDKIKFVCSPYEPERCRLIISTDLKIY